jgi:hypothetical protein
MQSVQKYYGDSFFSLSLPFAPFIFSKTKYGWYWGMSFCTHNHSCYECSQRSHNMLSDMLSALNTHSMSKTWTQSVFRYHKVKSKQGRGQTEGKNCSSTFVRLHLPARAASRQTCKQASKQASSPPNWLVYITSQIASLATDLVLVL